MKKDIKVMFICNYASVYAGNFIPSLLAIDEQLNGSSIFVLPRSAKQRNWVKDIANIEYIEFENNQISQINKLIEKHMPSVLHFHFGSVNIAKKIAKMHKDIKILVNIHSDFSAGRASLKDKIKNLLHYKFVPNNLHYISVSSDLVRLNPKKTTYINNALAIRKLNENQLCKENIRRKYNIDNDKIVCEIFGWSPYVKGVDVAAEAIKKANENENKFILAIICNENSKDEITPKYIKDHTTLNGDENYVIYLDPIEDVFAYHNAFDILISASRSEGFSYSILEMLSIGKRCIVSDIPGTKWSYKYPQVVEFETENIEDLVAALLKAANLNYDSRISIEDVKNNYSINEWAKRVISVYENI